MREPEQCLKCDHRWKTRKERRPDSRCPKCFNPNYWEPRVYQKHPKPLEEVVKESHVEIGIEACR